MTWMSLLLLFFVSPGWAATNQCTPFDRFVTDFIADSDGLFDQDYFDQHVEITFHDGIAKEIDHKNAVGVCFQQLSFPLKIQIEREWWYRTGDYDHWSILYHEIGHCACHEDHTSEKESEWFFDLLARNGVRAIHAPWQADGCPKSLMYPIVVGQDCIVRHEDEYVKELFAKCQKVTVPDQHYRVEP